MIHDDAYCDGVQAERPVFFEFLGKVKSLRNLAPRPARGGSEHANISVGENAEGYESRAAHKNRTGKKAPVLTRGHPILKACEP